MKNSILLLSFCILISGIALTHCSSPSENVKTAEDNVVTAKRDLQIASEKLRVDIESYRKDMAEQIAANDQKILDYKINMVGSNPEEKAAYRIQVEKLEVKNQTLKLKMKNYGGEGPSAWEAFKLEVVRDMKEINDAFRDLSARKAQ